MSSVPPEHQEPFTEWTRDDAAETVTIEVLPGEPAPFALPDTLFGAFIENLWDTIYGGLWAQILHNPSFEADCLSAFNVAEAVRAGRLVTDPSFAGGFVRVEPLEEETGAGQGRFLRSSGVGLPLPWEPLRPHGRRYELRHEADAPDGGRSLLLLGLSEHEVGVRQGVCLPVHRTRTFTGSLWVRSATSEGATLTVSLRRRDRPDEVLAQAVAGVPPSGPAAEAAGYKSTKPPSEVADTRTGTVPSVSAGDFVPLLPAASAAGPKAGPQAGTRALFTLIPPDGAVAPLEKVDFCLTLDHTDARVFVDDVRLWPDDTIEGFDPEVIAEACASGVKLLRRGGNFSSGYHWQDGVGPPETRRTLPNTAWGLPEYNHFGAHEFLRLCRLIGAEPQICVNAGSGEPDEAAAWVEYCNGDATGTTFGALRASHGHPEPYDVRWWEVGNELWGNFQMGWQTAEGNARRYVAFARAMKEADPSIRLIAVGGDADFHERWNAPLLATVANDLDLVATHWVAGMHPGDQQTPSTDDDHTHRADFALPAGTGRKLDEVRATFAAAGSSARIAFTEWSFWSPRLGRDPCFTNLGGAVVAASFLHMLARRAEFVPVANLSCLVQFAGVHRQRGAFFVTPTWLAFGEYAKTAGAHLVPVRLSCRGYDVTGGNRRLPDVPDVPLADALGVRRADGSLRLFLVNQSTTRTLPAQISVEEAASVRVRQMSDHDLAAANSPDEPQRVGWRDVPVQDAQPLAVLLPPHSITIVDVGGSWE